MPNIDDLLARVEAMRRLPSPDERRLLRMSAGLTRDEVASQLGVTSTALYQWETGRADPGKDTIEAYVALLERLQAEFDASGEG